MKKLVLIGLAGIVAGIVGWGGFNTVLEATNDMSFCISCHEMRDNVYVEYQQSPHYQNPSGVRATCPDCHVPRDWTHKVIRKVQASGEVFHWAMGSIDTPEKFEAKRHTLAVREWERMRASDSRECRNCHAFDAMAFHKQSMQAARAMRDAAKTGKTCIDCHHAVAHKMPDVTATHRRLFAALQTEAAQFRPAAGESATLLANQALSLTPAAPAAGEVAAGNTVHVLAVDGSFVQIEIVGWRRESSDAVLYTRQGKRILLANLDEAALAQVQSGRIVEDADTGLPWSEIRLRAWVPTGAFLPDAKKLWDYAERMTQDNCTLCHVRRAAGDYSANDWVGHVNSMKRLTPLNDAEAGVLLAYLQNHAKDSGR